MIRGIEGRYMHIIMRDGRLPPRKLTIFLRKKLEDGYYMEIMQYIRLKKLPLRFTYV